MGVLAIIPLVAFFGFGVLSKDDFNGFLWNVVMLAMGGLALGEAVQSSGLLATISNVSAVWQPNDAACLAGVRVGVSLTA
jgi:di/tricarboxylate transporter